MYNYVRQLRIEIRNKFPEIFPVFGCCLFVIIILFLSVSFVSVFHLCYILFVPDAQQQHSRMNDFLVTNTVKTV